MPSVASASFTRPFLRPLPNLEPQNLAVDSGDDLLVEVPGGLVDRFEPAYPPGENKLVGSEAGTLPNGQHGHEYRAESCVLGVCTVYVSEPSGVKRFRKTGLLEEPEEFTCGAACSSYVEGNKIVGVPAGAGGSFLCEGRRFATTGNDSEAITVDAVGDIFVNIGVCKAVFEFAPTGEFLRVFMGGHNAEVPRLGPEEGYPTSENGGIAVDASSGHLLVGVNVDTTVGHVGGVYEFDLETGKYVDRLIEAGEAGEGEALTLPREIVVDSLGDVYVKDAKGGERIGEERGVVDVWGAGAYFPSVVLGVAGGRTGSSAVLNGTVNPLSLENPAHAPLTGCHFQFVTEATFKHNVEVHGGHQREGFAELGAGGGEPECVPGPGGIEPNDTPQPVHAGISGLQPGVTYRYRLLATTDPEKKGGTRPSAPLAFTAPAAPRILSSSAGNVSSAFADLHAQIDPDGAATGYHFEYDTRPYLEGEAAHGVSVPSADVQIGSGGPSGSSPEAVLQHVGPLAPATTYYFRVVASNECEAVQHPGRRCVSEATAQSLGVFTTLPAVVHGLPDGRGYELVTPADKQGGSDMFAEPPSLGAYQNEHDVGFPAPAGEGFLLSTLSSFGEFPFANGGAYVFRRELAQRRWGFTSLASRSLGVQTPFEGPRLYSQDLSRVTVNDSLGSETGEDGASLTSLIGPPGAPGVCQGPSSLQEAGSAGCYIQLHTDPPSRSIDNEGSETLFVGGSSDLGRVVLESRSGQLCPGGEAVTHGHVLCEFSGGYETREGGVRPALSLVGVGDEGQAVSECGAALGNAYKGFQLRGSAAGAVSADGSRVLFTAPDPRAAYNAPALEGKEGCWNRFKEEKGEAPRNAPQLYDRIETGEGVFQTIKLSAPHEEGVSVPLSERFPARYVGASADGSRVFFVTQTELTKEAVALHLHDMELYEWRSQGVAGPGGVCEEPEGCLMRASAGEESQPGHEKGADVSHVLSVAADGNAIYFFATGGLATGGTAGVERNIYRYDTRSGATSFVAASAEYNNNGQFTCRAEPAPPCSDGNVYGTPDGRFLLFDDFQGLKRYDAATGATVVIAGPEAKFARSASKGGSDTPVRAMSDDGSYVFFDTPEPLVSQASNHNLDTYEWHEDLKTGERSISLIGSGSTPGPTYFLGYAPYTLPGGEQVEGGNVFIGTHAQLTLTDTAGLGNIYDARICQAASPCIRPPEEKTGPCSGSSCQTPPAPPAEPNLGSLALSGNGNISGVLPPPPPKHETAAQIRARRLAVALKLCRKKANRHNRAICEKAAHKKYGPIKPAKKAGRRR